MSTEVDFNELVKWRDMASNMGREVTLMTSKCRDIQELFSMEFGLKRIVLKDLCLNILQESGKCDGQLANFARDHMWRYTLHGPMSRARQIKKDKWTNLELTYVRCHLLKGISEMTTFLESLKELDVCKMGNIKLRKSAAEHITEEEYLRPILMDDGIDQSETISPPWVVNLIYMCLINIGDLYRYLTQLYKNDFPDEEESNSFYNNAQDSYIQAYLFCPDLGLAVNQLGNLSSLMGKCIDTTYYFFKSLLSAAPYDGAYSNLRQFMEQCIIQFARRPASMELTKAEVFNNAFLTMINQFMMEAGSNPNMQNLCEKALASFHDLDENDFQDGKFLFHSSCMTIMLVKHLQESNSLKVSVAVGYAFSMFFALMQRIGFLLEQIVVQIQVQPPSLQSSQGEEMESICTISTANDNSSQEEKMSVESAKKKLAPTLPGRRVLQKRFKRQRAMMGWFDELDPEDDENSSDEFDDDEQDSESEMSSGSLGEFDFNMNSSDEEDSYNEEQNSEDVKSSGDVNGISTSGSSSLPNDDSGSGRSLNETQSASSGSEGDTFASTRQYIGPEELEKCWDEISPCLIAVLPFIRWLETSDVITTAFASNCEKIFMERICSVLSFLGISIWPKVLGNLTIRDELMKQWDNLAIGNIVNAFEWELEEDRSMLGMTEFKSINISMFKSGEHLSVNDKKTIRIGRVLYFGYWMASKETFSVVHSDGKFRVVLPEELRTIKMESRFLKLQNENVNKLTKAYQNMATETNRKKRPNKGGTRAYENGRRPKIDPVMVVIDLEGLMFHLRRVKDMCFHEKYIVVIPHAVHHALDEIKDDKSKEGKRARNAARWLEKAINRRYRGVRFQREHERISLRSYYPFGVESESPEAKEFFDIMESCNYIYQNEIQYKNPKRKGGGGSHGMLRDQYRIYYLTGADKLIDGSSFKFKCDPLALSHSVGAYMDCITLYPDNGGIKKWQGKRTAMSKCNG